MKVETSLGDADVSHPSVVSIGNFDGLHLGHKEILRTVAKRSRELGLRPVVGPVVGLQRLDVPGEHGPDQEPRGLLRPHVLDPDP